MLLPQYKKGDPTDRLFLLAEAGIRASHSLGLVHIQPFLYLYCLIHCYATGIKFRT
jgi:hypothetical protein